MLYVNVYLVSQLYGGPEEGGWYYHAGEPLGSIPIKTKPENKDYYLSSEEEGHGRIMKMTKITIHLRECCNCKGTGEVEEESEDLDEKGEPYLYMTRCQSCGEVPEDLEATGKLMVETHNMFDSLPGRYQHIRVMLQDHFAAPFPERKPHYE